MEHLNTFRKRILLTPDIELIELEDKFSIRQIDEGDVHVVFIDKKDVNTLIQNLRRKD